MGGVGEVVMGTWAGLGECGGACGCHGEGVRVRKSGRGYVKDCLVIRSRMNLDPVVCL